MTGARSINSPFKNFRRANIARPRRSTVPMRTPLIFGSAGTGTTYLSIRPIHFGVPQKQPKLRRSSHSGKTETLFMYFSSVRSEERRVGEEGRSRGAPDHLKKKKKK